MTLKELNEATAAKLVKEMFTTIELLNAQSEALDMLLPGNCGADVESIWEALKGLGIPHYTAESFAHLLSDCWAERGRVFDCDWLSDTGNFLDTNS